MPFMSHYLFVGGGREKIEDFLWNIKTSERGVLTISLGCNWLQKNCKFILILNSKSRKWKIK